MLKKILIPADGSANGDTALKYGIYVAKKLAASLVGLHVLDVQLLQGPLMTDISGAVGMPPCEGFIDAIETSLNEKADFILDNFRQQCKNAGLEHEERKVIGKIEEVIIEEAQNVDFILMAKKGEHFHIKEGGLLGSVSQAVTRRSGKPVMVTPDKYRDIESMGVAYDGSPSSKKALDLALIISRQTSWPLTAIIITADEKKATMLSSQIEETAQAKETECATIILSGKEAEEIIKFIREDAVELMVMGAFGHNRLRELLLGSTTAYVISKSSIPVLLTH